MGQTYIDGLTTAIEVVKSYFPNALDRGTKSIDLLESIEADLQAKRLLAENPPSSTS